MIHPFDCHQSPFIIWTWRRAGGTNLAQALFDFSKFDSLEHEPFNIDRTLGFIQNNYKNDRDLDKVRCAIKDLLVRKPLIKHCLEIIPTEINQILMEESINAGYKHLFLYRDEAVNRLLSLNYAQCTDIWGKEHKKSKKVNKDVFTRTINVSKLINHEKHSRGSLTSIFNQLLTRNQTPLSISFERLYQSNDILSRKLVLEVFKQLEIDEVFITDKVINKIIKKGAQGTNQDYLKFPKSEELILEANKLPKFILCKETIELVAEVTTEFNHVEIWEPTIGVAENTISISGVFLTNAKGRLSLSSSRGKSASINHNIVSPRIGTLYPNDNLSGRCSFSSDFISYKKGDTLLVNFESDNGDMILVAELKERIKYDGDFYSAQKMGSKISAHHYLSHLFGLFKPKSLVDFGCGVGTWIKEANEIGIETVLGLDGNWVQSVDNFLGDNILFKEVDLNTPQILPQQFDMVMSLEVAEHLNPENSQQFIKSLCKAGDVIMFGAAYIGQPGRDHRNCQKHSYWADLFDKEGYKPFDLFRSKFWGSDIVEPWYQQNTFLYIKENTPAFSVFTNQGFMPMSNLSFMDVIHPWLYHRYYK